MTSLALVLATFGYSGYAPVAPGTAGSAAALVLYAILRWGTLTWIELPLIVALFAAGIWAADVTARHTGRVDPGIVVVDEVVGMLITVAWLSVGVVGAVIGFLLFRIFDILKPFPAAQSERLPGGLGIMVDDVVAGVYAHLVLRALAWAWPALVLQS
jgi:phosphatidylglycerophosphatase A